ncbi:MAG: M15 family metallopeptidase [Aquabacterium sp.]
MSNPDTDATRRAYWTEQLEAAWRFMFEAVLPCPVAECGEPLVSLQQAVEQAEVVVQFSERPHALGQPRLFYLRDGQIPGFIGAAAEMNERGWIMRVEDGYRTPRMQKHLASMPQVFDAVLRAAMWELGGTRPTSQFLLRRCSALVANVPKVGTHMSGSAIDISVMLRDDPAREVDRGAPYLEMSALTPMDSPFVGEAARRNRRDITALMRRHGFVEYPWEFWHYSSGDAYEQVLLQTGRPAIYAAIAWDPATGQQAMLPQPEQPLNSAQDISAAIDAALARAAAGGPHP